MGRSSGQTLFSLLEKEGDDDDDDDDEADAEDATAPFRV
jgi:hypothetical protein